MPRIQATIGSLSLSNDEAMALLKLLQHSRQTTNNGRTKAVVDRLALRCRTILDTVCAAEEGMSFAEDQCPGHVWTYSGTAYGGDDETYHGEGRCYCELCGADGDA